MRRETRPFVVEVRRGQKKAQPAAPAPDPFAEPIGDDEMMRRAEAALFGRPASTESAAPTDAEPAKPARRILEAIVPTAEAEPELEAPEVELPKRRGRKPGSRNKPKVAADLVDAPKRRRGRPPKLPEQSVRSVEVTPELAQAALASIEGAAPLPRTAAPVTAGTPSGFDPPKRPRGRPRKELAVPATAALPEEIALPSGRMSTDRILRRYGADAGPAAGQIWTRRLRGYANPDHLSRRRGGA